MIVFMILQLQHLLLVVLLVVGTQLVSGQDYQDYQENTPRAAPLRLRPQSNLVEQPQQRVAPVAILKQINKHNEDGSYTYGYEGADGSFKIETKLATGEVKGKYGYVDETGKVRVVEYGANQYGFQPSGEGITVAPPTLVDESAKDEPEYEDEPIKRPQQQQYRYQQRPQIQHRPSLPPPPPPPQAPPQRPQPQYVQYEEEEEEPEPPRRQYAPQAAPAPPRLQIPGGQRTTEVLYTAVPRPVHPEAEYSQIQSYGDAGSNLRISRPVYAPPPSNPSPSSARAHGFLAPASGRPLLSAFDFGPSSTPRAQQAIPTQQLARYQPQPQTPPQHRYQPQPSIQVQPQYPQPQPQPQAHAQPQPQPQPQPQSQHQSQYQPQSRGGSSLLDQLARDYALPQSNSQPLHDISFGYY